MAIIQLRPPHLNNLLQVQMTCYWFTISPNKGNKQEENRAVHTNSIMYSSSRAGCSCNRSIATKKNILLDISFKDQEIYNVQGVPKKTLDSVQSSISGV